MLKITNVTAGLSSQYANYHVACECDGARYHIWVDKDTHQPFYPQTLYKNSLAKYGEPGYYKTRHLKPDSKFASEMVAALLHEAAANNLYEKADQKLADELAAEQATHKAAVAVRVAKDAGPEMLKVLESIYEFWRESRGRNPLWPGAMILDDDETIFEAIERVTLLAKKG
jgi:hypothetical protein